VPLLKPEPPALVREPAFASRAIPPTRLSGAGLGLRWMPPTS
jgi:hypothetical protein